MPSLQRCTWLKYQWSTSLKICMVPVHLLIRGNSHISWIQTSYSSSRQSIQLPSSTQSKVQYSCQFHPCPYAWATAHLDMLQESENNQNSLYQTGCILNSAWIIYAYLSLSFFQMLLKSSTIWLRYWETELSVQSHNSCWWFYTPYTDGANFLWATAHRIAHH